MVCTANQCRSPIAELLLTRALVRGTGRSIGSAPRVEVSSAGVRAVDGSPVTVQTAEQLALRGVDSDGFRARWLTDAMVRQADLVLTATREHRSHVLERVPLALRRTFTLLEFAAITSRITGGQSVDPADPAGSAGSAGSAGLSAWVRRAAAARGTTPVSDYDIPDPVGGSDEDVARTVAIIEAATARIADAMLWMANHHR